MRVQVDFYRTTGKWYSGGEVECDKLPYEDGVLDSILANQKILSNDCSDYYIVLGDLPESVNDVNYRMTYARLYHPRKEKK